MLTFRDLPDRAVPKSTKKKTKKRTRDELVYRWAVTGDVPHIHQLVNKFARRRLMLGRSLGELYEMVRDFVVCEKKGRILGCGAIKVVWDDLAEIKSVAVDPRNQGKGIGRKIVGMLNEDAKRFGVERTFVLTFKPEFFAKMGFEEVEKEELPHKIWTECIRCPMFPNCDEVAMVRKI
jgi:amino-acid N-acetyltransferase